jgi:membrane protein
VGQECGAALYDESMNAAMLARLFKQSLSAWWNDNALRLGASLAFYTLFAIAPVLLVAIAIAGLVFGPEAVRGEIGGQMQSLVGRDGAQAVQALLEGASKRQSGIFATVVGTATLLLAATGAFLELQAALNAIWRVKPNPDANLMAYLTARLRSFAIVVAIGFLLLVSLVISAGLAAINGWLARRAPGWPILLQAINVTASFAVTAALFALLFRFLPDVKLEWRDVATGSIVTAVLFTAGKHVIGLYLGQSTTASSYGAAASVILLLLWVYYSSQIVLFGAEFTRIYAAARGDRPPPEEFAEPDPRAPANAT